MIDADSNTLEDEQYVYALKELDTLMHVCPGDYYKFRYVILDACRNAKHLRDKDEARASVDCDQIRNAINTLEGLEYPLQQWLGGDKYFTEIVKALKKKADEAKRWPYWHRNVIGPLLYDIRMDTQFHKPDPVFNGLLFNLVLRMRDWTEKGFVRVLDTGAVMPEYGRPHYKIVALFAAATLDRKTTAADVKNSLTQLLRNHKGITWGHWPKV